MEIRFLPEPFVGEGVHGVGFEINPQLTIRILKALFGKSTAGMGFEVFLEICSLFGAAKG